MQTVLQPTLKPFQCPKCGKLIVWTVAGAKVHCKKCKIWIDKPADNLPDAETFAVVI